SWKQHCLREVLPDIDLARVHFLDRLPHASLRALMQVSTTHVYLTYPFVLSWSCIEALSVGCAIVASDTAPVRDVIVDDENGVLTSFHDHRALAAAICELLADPTRRARLSRAARETALASFDISLCVRRTLDILGVDSEDRSTKAAGHLPAAVTE
ncbi:MAG TPA: glycosyltransferase, partial [Polyangia bacterium]